MQFLDPNSLASFLDMTQCEKCENDVECEYHEFSGRNTSSVAEEEQVYCLCLVKQCECYHSDPKADSENSL